MPRSRIPSFQSVLLLVLHAVAGAALADGGSARLNPSTDSTAYHGDHNASLDAARQAGGDADGDGLDDYEDNCAALANADQRDTDGDGYGNLCDADLNNDGVVNTADLGLLRLAFFTSPGVPGWNPDADFNGDNTVNALDLGTMRAGFFAAPGPSGMSCAGSAPCPAATLRFAWPMPGDDADEWVINNYVDLDPSSGILDFAGGAKSYDGHRGIDIDVPTFRAMDNNFPILASAEGVVLALEDGNFDRNTSCTGSWNYVTIGHPNGWKTIYGHLKQNSVVVNVGDIVSAGTTLGVVGSSGCSTAPHLHMETQDANGTTVEPFAQGMWINPPVYNTQIGFMDATLYATAINNVDMIKDPAPNATLVSPGGTFGMGLSIGGGAPGDVINLRIVKGGSIVAQNNIAFNQVYRHSYWWWNYGFAASASGAHQLQIRINGSLAQSYNFDVQETFGGYAQVRHGVPAANYQALFDALTANGFRPVWVDGYDVNGQTYYNVIFNQSAVASWSAAHGMTSSQYQTYFTAQTQAGRRLVHVDSYRQGSTVRYAAIFVQQGGSQWVAYHNASAATHQSLFNSYTSQGYRASIISSVQSSSGVQTFTALYDKNPVGGWVALANLTSAQYQAEFNTQVAAGRTLAYIDGYTLNGVPRFSAIWNSVVPSGWVARHDLTSSQFQNEFDQWTGAGLSTRMISGYESGGIARFAGYWSN